MKISRRSFVATAGLVASASPYVVPRSVLGAGVVAPSDKPVLLGIGVGGIGNSHTQEASGVGFQIGALCDLDWNHAEKTFKLFPDARKYKDFREALDKEGDKIDCVYCGTPDHTHAIVTLAALRARKPTCCVKPLTRTIEEGRAVAEAAKKRASPPRSRPAPPPARPVAAFASSSKPARSARFARFIFGASAPSGPKARPPSRPGPIRFPMGSIGTHGSVPPPRSRSPTSGPKRPPFLA